MNEFSGAHARRIAVKFGESPSSLDWGYGDAVELSDGAISASDNTFTSASASFDAEDAGKTICIIGAGAAGVPLTTTITSVTSATEVELTAAAGTTVTGADFVYGTDNTAAFAAGIVEATSRDRAFTIIGGKYLLTGQIDMEDLSGFTVTGQGGTSILIPVSSLSDNLFDCSGCTDGEYSHFTIDGYYLRKASLMLSALYGDGTATNGTYGNIRVRGLRIKNWEQQGIGIGANVGYTVEDIEITDNYFDECGVGWLDGSFGGGPIDTGSGGTGRRYKIMRNKIRMASTSTLHVDAIFCGHGKKYDFLICDNQIFDSSGHGIQLHARPFADADVDCEFEGAIVKGNLIRGAGTSAIGNLGASRCQIVGNTIIDPCSIVGHSTSAITISHAITSQDPIEVNGPIYDIQIADNIITDTRTVSPLAPMMQYGIRISAVDVTATGVIDGNLISNYGTDQILWENNQANFTTRLVNPGGQTHNYATKHIHYGANVGTQNSEGNSIGAWVIQKSAVAGGGYRIGIGFNCQFDGSNWVTGADGGSNGGAVVIAEYGGATPQLEFYTIPSTGGAAQTISNASLASYLRKTITSDAIESFTNRLQISGTAASQSDFVLKKNAATSGMNVEFRISHRDNGEDLLIYSYDGTSEIGWLHFDKSIPLLTTAVGFRITPLAGGAAPARISANGDIDKGKIALTDANDVSGASLTANAPLIWDGSKVASLGAFTANNNVITDGDGKLKTQSLTADSPLITDGAGLPYATTWESVYNAIKSYIDTDFITTTDLATYTYSQGEIDTLLAGKAEQASFAAHTHSVSGSTGETSGHTHSVGITTSTP